MTPRIRAIAHSVDLYGQGPKLGFWKLRDDGKYITKDSALLPCPTCGDRVGVDRTVKTYCHKCMLNRMWLEDYLIEERTKGRKPNGVRKITHLQEKI